MLKVTCIIPSLCSEKSYPILRECILSLQKSSTKARVKLNIVIVSNGEKLILKDLRKYVSKILRIPNPYSFAKMNNRAIDYSLNHLSQDWVLLINDDAYVEKNFFKIFSNNKLARSNDIIIPLVYEGEGPQIDSFGIDYFNSGYARNARKLNIRTELAAAACLFLKTTLLETMKDRYGFCFNEILKAYYDDVEFSIRARGVGATIYKNTDLYVHHMVSFTNIKGSRYMGFQAFRNLIWVLIMTWPKKELLHNFTNIVLVQLWALLYTTATYGPFLYISIWIDTFTNLPKLLSIRKKIISAYITNFNFKSLTANYAFRTYKGSKGKFKIINKIQNLLGYKPIKI